MNQKRDKFLTEAMGECWHESGPGQTDCKHCGRNNDPRYFDFDVENHTFSSWSGFGKLWRWSQTQDWWKLFVMSLWCLAPPDDEYFFVQNNVCLPSDYINPDCFASELYKYLHKEKLNK
jgi:hypothetical protein